MKKTWRKSLAALTAVVMVLSLGVFPAAAKDEITSAVTVVEPVAEVIGGASYPTLSEAVDAAGDGTTIKLLQDITMETQDIVVVPADKALTLDLNKKSIITSDSFAGRPIVNEGTLIVTGEGVIDSSMSESGGYGAINNKGTLTIKNGIYRGAIYASGSVIRNTGADAELNIENGVFEGATCAVFNEGIAIIDGGTFSGKTCSTCNSDIWSYTIRNSTEDSRMTINDGAFTGTQGAVSAAVGHLEINGGNFRTVDCARSHGAIFYALYAAGEVGAVECIINGGTFETEGTRTAVLIGNDNTGGDGGINAPATAYVNGGTFKAPAGVPALKGAAKTGDPIITGGIFSSDVSAYVDSAAGYSCVQIRDNEYVVKPPAAKIGETAYPTLAAAVAAAGESDTITLMNDVELTEPIIIDKPMTIDGDGHSITGAAAAAQPVRRMGLFHLFNEADSPVTFTIKNAELVNLAAGGNKWNEACGISVRASNQTVNLTNVTMETSYYCLFVGVPGGEHEDVNDVTLNVKDSMLTGYAAVYYRTNSETNMILRPILNVAGSSLYGRGVSGYSNDFSTIVYNGTRSARATIEASTLSNSINSSNENANQGVIQFNCYGAYEKDAVVTIKDSVIKTASNSAAPNVIKYTCSENLDAENKVIIDNLTFTKGDSDGDLIRAMRNGNELVATGIDLKAVLEVAELGDATEEPAIKVIKSGDNVLVPVNTTVSANTAVPDGVTVTVASGAALTVNKDIILTGGPGAKLIVNGSVSGVTDISRTGIYHWQDGRWVRESSGGSGGGTSTPPPKTETESKTEGDVKTETTTTTTTNKDGSKTTETKETAVNTATGEKTETKSTETVSKDGSVTREESKVTTTAEGGRTEETTTATVDAKTGTSATTTVKTDESGKSTAAILVENGKGAKEVTVSAAAVKGAAKADEATMTVRTAGAEITLDAAAIAAVAETRGESVSISVETVTAEALPEAAKAYLGDAVVVDLSISVGDTRVSTFNGGTARVAVPYARTDSSKAVAVFYVEGTGKMTRVPGAAYDETTKSVVFTTGHFSYYAVKEETPLAFTDVTDGDWYYEAVRYVAEAGLFNGTGAATFGPAGTMTREMLAAVLYRKAGSPAAEGQALDGFADGAQVSAWAKDAMGWAVRSGILAGMGDNRLDPQGAVTRQQLAVILYRAAGGPGSGGTALSGFSDGAQVAGWASEAVSWAVETGVLTGRGDGTLDPAGCASRAEVAAMLLRTVK